MGSGDVYTCVEPIVYFFEVFGLTPYNLHVGTNGKKSFTLNIFSYLIAVVTITASLAAGIKFFIDDFHKFREDTEEFEMLSNIMIILSENLHRFMLPIFAAIPLIYYKEVIEVFSILFKVDHILYRAGISFNNRKMTLYFLLFIVLSSAHSVVRIVVECYIIEQKSVFEWFYTIILHLYYTYSILWFLFVSFLIRERFRKLRRYLLLHGQKKEYFGERSELKLKKEFLSVGLNGNLQLFDLEPNLTQEHILRQTMVVQSQLQDAIERLNKYYQIPLFFICVREFINVVYSCYVFYGVYSGATIKFETILDQAVIFSQSYLKVIIVSWICDLVVEESKAIFYELCIVARRPTNTERDKKLIRFFFLQLQHLSDYAIGFSSFFPIDCTTHFDMITTMFNYLMVTISIRYY